MHRLNRTYLVLDRSNLSLPDTRMREEPEDEEEDEEEEKNDEDDDDEDGDEGYSE